MSGLSSHTAELPPGGLVRLPLGSGPAGQGHVVGQSMGWEISGMLTKVPSSDPTQQGGSREEATLPLAVPCAVCPGILPGSVP